MSGSLTFIVNMDAAGPSFIGAGSCLIFGYTFALNSAKTVKSLTLPSNRNVLVT